MLHDRAVEVDAGRRFVGRVQDTPTFMPFAVFVLDNESFETRSSRSSRRPASHWPGSKTSQPSWAFAVFVLDNESFETRSSRSSRRTAFRWPGPNQPTFVPFAAFVLKQR